MFTPQWTALPSPREAPGLSPGALDLWLIDLDRPPESSGGLLSGEEQTIAERFIHAHDRRRYRAARGALRFVLGEYLGCDPKTIAFELGPWGKPGLAWPRTDRVAFNLAHSGGQALIALGVSESLGVDLEAMRPIDDWLGVARLSFAPAEVRSVLDLPEPLRMEGFFACWSRKEAIIKLWGEGFSADLQSFEVSTDPRTPARLVSLSRAGSLPEEIRLWGFKPTAGAWAAVAAPAAPHEIDLRFWRLAD